MLPERGWSSACRLRASDMDVPTSCPETASGLRSQGYSWPPTASRVNLWNQGPHVSAEQAKPGKPPSPATSHVRGGASVVVRTRESRVHGEGRQSTSTASKPQGKAMYVATSSDKDWLLSKQQKPYARSYDKTPDFASTSMESPVHSERCTPGSERGARKPIGASR